MSETRARSWIQARARLEMIAKKADPETRRHLDELGLAEGWNCLEVGAGSGSLAKWVAHRVGASGRVVATDLDTELLEKAAGDNLEVKRHDLDKDPLPTGAYDLVVARYVFEWLADPRAVLDKLLASLAPNGWLLIESGDWGALPPVTSNSHEQQRKVREAFFEFLGQSFGYHPDVGRQLVGMLETAGLEHVGATGRSVLLRGGSPEVQLYKYELELVGSQMVEAGRISNLELAAVMKLYDDPKFCMMSPLTITAWGRRGG
jgi:SAM-dependent methyltransferase